jgi:O-antigen/teichoic acid export membrane protein
MMLDQIIKFLVGILISIYVIRYLGPNDFGVLSYSIAIIGVMYPIATLGTDPILFRNILNDKNKTSVYLHTARVIRLFASTLLVVSIVIFLLLSSESEELKNILYIMLVGLFFDVSRVYKEYFLSISQNQYIAISSIVSVLLSNFLKLTFIIFNLSVIWFAVAFTLSKVLDYCSLRYFYRKLEPNDRSTFDLSVAKKLFHDSWPLIFTSFAGLLYLSTDQILVKNLLGYEELGLYSAGTKLVLVLLVIPPIISNILYPRILDSYRIDPKEKFIDKLKLVYFFNLALALSIYVFFLFFGDLIIELLFGGKYVQSGIILKTYSATMIFVFFNALNNKLLILANLQKLMLSRNILGLIINLFLGLVLIPKIGIIGAAIGTLITQFLVMLSYGLHNKTRYILWLQLKSLIYPYYFLKERT